MTEELQLPDYLIHELRGRMTITRLAKTGFFRKLSPVPEEISREVDLFRAVLDKALIDYFSNDRNIQGDVADWLDLDNKDFILCCERAFLPANLVFKSFAAVKKVLRK